MPRRLTTFLCAAALSAGLLSAVPAQASTTAASAAAAVTCTAVQPVFGVSTTGTLYHYPFNDLSTTATPIAGARTAVGSGWGQFGRVFGGANGKVYGLKTEGLYEYKWLGTGFAGAPRNITTTFRGFLSSTNRNRLTVDETGSIYAITGTGSNSLYRYNIDPVQGKIVSSQLMDYATWGDYNLIVGAGNGVIYSRNAAGELYRTRFDPASHRLISPTRRVGTGWNIFSSIMSVGGDILLGVKPTGELVHYRYDEQSSSWPILGRQIGAGWNQFTNVPVITDSCKQASADTPAPVSLPADPGAPIAVLPSPDGAKIDYSYVDSNTGRVLWGHQPDPNLFSSIVWPAPPITTDTYAGVPGLVTHGPGQVGIVAQRNDGHFTSTAQSAPDSETLQAWRPEGGIMSANATAVSMTMEHIVGKPVVRSLNAVDSSGALWRSTVGAPTYFSSWTREWSGSLVGTPLTVPWYWSTSLTVARTSTGGFAGWTEGFADFPQPPKQFTFDDIASTGRFSMINVGDTAHLFVRNTTGAIFTREIGFSTKTTPAGVYFSDWTRVGGDQVSFAGSPSAIALPNGDIKVAARGTDGRLFVSTAEWVTNHSFTAWEPVSNYTFAGDPTTFTYTNQAGPAWAVISYTEDYQVNAFTPGSSAQRTTTAIPDGFVRHILKEGTP